MTGYTQIAEVLVGSLAFIAGGNILMVGIMWVWLQWQERGPCAAPSPISHLTPDPSLRTARILATWTIRGFVHGAARRGGKWRSAMVRCTSVLVLPAVTVATWMQLRSPSTTFYMSHGASLAVQSVRRGRAWYLCDHSSERPGSGLGAQLRQEVSEHLTREACGTGVELRLRTRVPAVAQWALSAGFAEQSHGYNQTFKWRCDWRGNGS